MVKHWLLFFALCIASVHAQQLTPMADPLAFKNKLKDFSKKTNSIVSDFVEEKTSSYLKEPQRSSGIFYYKKNDKLRWEKTKPSKYIFISNDDKVRIQDNGKEINVSSAGQAVEKIKELMLTLVNGEFDSEKLFKLSYFFTDDHYVVKLIPKNKRLKNLYSYIQVSFSKETLLLKELCFFEKSGDKSIMTFSNSRTNETVADSIFLNF